MRICKHCGKEFVPNKYDRNKQKYCSDKCRHIKWKEYMVNYHRKRKQKVLDILGLGNKYILCEKDKRIIFHEIHGKNHHTSNYIKNHVYILAHLKDFVPVCYGCHTFIHRVKKENIVKLEELLRIFHESLNS